MAIPAAVGPIIGSGLSAIGGIVGSNINGNMSRKNMRLQAQLNQEAIDKQNQYNLPVNQRERFEAAGYNPWLMQGDVGNQNSSAQTSLAQPDVGGPIANGFLGAAQMIGNLAVQGAQIRKTNAEADIVEKDAKVRDDMNLANLDILQQQGRDWKFKVEHMNDQELAKVKADVDLLVQKYKSEIQNTSNLEELGKKIISETRLNNLKGDEQDAINGQIVEYLQLQRRMFQMEIDTGYRNARSNEVNAAANVRNAVANERSSFANERNSVTNEKVGEAHSGLMGAQKSNVYVDTLNKGIGAIENLFGLPARLRMLYDRSALTTKQLEAFDTDKIFERIGNGINGGSEVSGNIRDWRLVNSQIDDMKNSKYGNAPYSESVEHYNSKGKMTRRTVKKGIRIGRLR